MSSRKSAKAEERLRPAHGREGEGCGGRRPVRAWGDEVEKPGAGPAERVNPTPQRAEGGRADSSTTEVRLSTPAIRVWTR